MDGLDGLRIRTEGRVSVLSFQNVSSHDYGNYSCSASNPLGTANASLLATRVTSLSYPVYSKGGGPAGRAAWSRRGSAGLAAMTAIFVVSSFYL
uniref:protein CEPU-1-like n=1 Tax=Myxine glutinosa TaxID=7769 RepID=UPI00358DF9DC